MVDTSELDIANINPFRYRSYYYDTDTGWYYLNSRYYNPLLCRFITMDSVEYLGASGSMLSLNLYAYCENNPIMYVDPKGHSALRWPGEIHNLVIKDIIENHPNFIANVCMIGNGKRLFCDLMLIEGETAYIWEVKSCTVNFNSALDQLSRYLSAIINYKTRHNKRLSKVKNYLAGGYLESNTFPKTTSSGTYEITYWYERSGIIYYRYRKIKDSNSYEFDASTSAIIGITGMSMALMAYCAGGIISNRYGGYDGYAY